MRGESTQSRRPHFLDLYGLGEGCEQYDGQVIVQHLCAAQYQYVLPAGGLQRQELQHDPGGDRRKDALYVVVQCRVPADRLVAEQHIRGDIRHADEGDVQLYGESD